MVQTAESALSEIAGNLMRMRQLAVQAVTGVIQTTERAYIQTEFAALQTEINRIANVTEFNGLKLADNGSALTIQVGIGTVGANDQIVITRQKADTSATGLAIVTNKVDSQTAAQAAITALDTALTSVNQKRANYGAVQNSLASALHNLESYTENLVAAESRIRDVDFAAETADMTRNSVFQQAGISVLSQANSSPQAALQLLQ